MVRRQWDSNPRAFYRLWFSRPAHSSTLPYLQTAFGNYNKEFVRRSRQASSFFMLHCRLLRCSGSHRRSRRAPLGLLVLGQELLRGDTARIEQLHRPLLGEVKLRRAHPQGVDGDSSIEVGLFYIESVMGRHHGVDQAPKIREHRQHPAARPFLAKLATYGYPRLLYELQPEGWPERLLGVEEPDREVR